VDVSVLRWGIIGVGRAGRARAAAITADPRGEAVLGYRGRPEAAGLAAADSAQALIAAVDAVAICSPDDTHPDLVAAALHAGRHVLCEFPLAPTAAAASDLLALAGEQGRVLHVEHIELLGSAAAWWRQQRLGGLLGGAVEFQSSRQDVSVTDGGLARLHRILDILGPPDALRVDARTPAWLAARLRWGEAEVDLEFRSGAGLTRSTIITLDCDLGRLQQRDREIFIDDEPVPLPPEPGLFLTDQLAASAAMLDGAPHYLPTARLLYALRLRDALRAAGTGSWQGLSSAG
jgi:biliverdin reductase